jgi:hypothetical protein
MDYGSGWCGREFRQDIRSATVRCLQHFTGLAEIPGVSFFSLQKGAAAVEMRKVSFRVHDWTSEFHDFADTAALIDALDLVISVDTSVAHLAGALGMPVWLLNRFDT